MTDRQRLIFLDIDGVLNASEGYPDGYITPHLHHDKIALLNRIVSETDAGIVLHTNWRLPQFLGPVRTMEALRAAGLVARYTGQTQLGSSRGQELLQWRLVCLHVGNYVALDDRTDYLPGQHVIHPAADVGLTAEQADHAILILRGA